MSNRQEIVDRILSERERNFNLPGSEWDMKNTPNDWISIATSYLSSASSRKHTLPAGNDFEEELIKSAAVILAALEYVNSMRNNGTLR
jgi:hypothetical protein